MEDTCPILQVALILSYKRSTLVKEKKECHLREKLQEKQKSRDRLKADRGKITEINEN